MKVTQDAFNFRPSTPWQRGSHASFTGAVAAAPHAASQQARLLAEIFHHGHITQAELEHCTGYPINVVTARVRALVKAGQVIADGFQTVHWDSGRTTRRTLWRVTTRDERDDGQRQQAMLEDSAG